MLLDRCLRAAQAAICAPESAAHAAERIMRVYQHDVIMMICDGAIRAML